MTTRPRVEISVEMRAKELPIASAKFRRDVAKAVAEAGFRGALSVAVVSDATMQRVNAEFHDCDEPTDVLAFALGRGTAGSRATGAFDAEVIVSLDTARREAAGRGQDFAAELMLYVVHGVLHLLGFDDHSLADARRMHARALAILAGLGYTTTIRPRAKRRSGAPKGLPGERGPGH